MHSFLFRQVLKFLEWPFDKKNILGKGSDQTIKAGSGPVRAPLQNNGFYVMQRAADMQRSSDRQSALEKLQPAGVFAVGRGDVSPSQPAHFHSPQDDALQELPEAPQRTHALHQSRQPLQRSANVDVETMTGAGRAHPALRPRLPPQPVGSCWQTPATSVDAVRQGSGM
jgi:hypothetical protein